MRSSVQWTWKVCKGYDVAFRLPVTNKHSTLDIIFSLLGNLMAEPNL